MLDRAKAIAELANSLGTLEGLRQVNSEIELLNACLTHKDVALSRAELARINGALATLSGVLIEMGRVVRAMLAESGVRADHVG